MKLTSKKIGLSLRLGAMAAALLVGQQAMAAGTAAGTDITNTVSVGYSVNNIPQNNLPASVSFVVDRRVNFTLEPVSTPGLEPIVPGGSDYFVDFTLTNLSNSALDFDFALANVLSGVDVDGVGNTDDVDLLTFDWAVVTAGDPTPTRTTGAQIADELAADASVRIRVFADAQAALTNGQIAGLELTATAHEAGAAGLGAALSYGDANGDLTIQSVDALTGQAGVTDGVRVSVDGFEVVTADLTVTKAYSVTGGDFGSGLPIPGAEVEYTITIVNSSTTTAASSVAISDTLDDNVDFALGAVGGNDIVIDNAGTPSNCTSAADTDDCELVGGVLTFDNLTIAADTTLVVTYRVTIQDPNPTP